MGSRASSFNIPYCTLTHLDMDDNAVGDDGAVEFAALLQFGRCSLSALSLQAGL